MTDTTARKPLEAAFEAMTSPTVRHADVRLPHDIALRLIEAACKVLTEPSEGRAEAWTPRDTALASLEADRAALMEPSAGGADIRMPSELGRWAEVLNATGRPTHKANVERLFLRMRSRLRTH